MSTDILLEDKNIELKYCRYCLSCDTPQDLITPCRCKGSLEVIHSICLQKWLIQKNNRIVIPGMFSQFNYACEICKTEYNIEFIRKPLGEAVYFEIFGHVFIISCLLFVYYLLLGLFMGSYTGFFFIFGSKWENIIGNGFLFGQLTILFIYLVMFMCMLRESCRCCLFMDCENDQMNSEMFCCILIIMSIFGTFLIIYFDIIIRIVQRARNRSKVIIKINPFIND